MPSRYPNMGHAALVNLLVRLNHVTETFLKSGQQNVLALNALFLPTVTLGIF
jgi:hypothetical protein